jgi:hypothetical protein
MKSLMLLWQELLLESGSRCSVSTALDLTTVERRVEEEGESFLTITLPTFADSLQKGLEAGKVTPSDFPSFAFARRKGESVGLPKLFRGFLELIFDSGSGLLLASPSVEAISCVRQLSLAFYKILLESTPARKQKAMEGYYECEKEVKEHDSRRSAQQISDFSRVAHLLFGRVYPELNFRLRHHLLQGAHGPGSTADRLSGNGKWDQSEWTWRLERVFPASGYLVPNDRHYKWLSRLNFLEPGHERPVRIVDVPKTVKTPRIIAMEPTCMMFAQKAVADALIPMLESDKLISGMIGFKDQGLNRLMAQEGSLSRGLATLDLSEASDRVSNQLVRAMFAWQPRIAEAVDATRSRSADVPGFGVLRLAKYASMGSALTFPIEAMVFLTIVFLAIERELNSPLTEGAVRRFKGQVRIYGDDIIVPVEFAEAVVLELEAYGLKVNRRKSFWNGQFRESCGGEYFDGSDVTIVRFRQLLPLQRRHGKEIKGTQAQRLISAVSLRNQLYLAGWWRATAWLDDYIGRVIPFPTVSPTSPVLGRWSFLGYHAEWTHRTLHAPVVKGYVVSARSPASPLGGTGALMKVFSNPLEAFHTLQDVTDIATRDAEHLDRAGRPSAVCIKLRKASPY